MVKASVMAGAGGRGYRRPAGEEIDYGLPLTHPALYIPIIGLIIMGTMALVTCFCKCWPELVPEKLKICGKRSVDKNLELQLGRRSRRASSQIPGPSNERRNRSSRTPSFNYPKPDRPRDRDRPRIHKNNIDIEAYYPASYEMPPPSYESIIRGQVQREHLV